MEEWIIVSALVGLVVAALTFAVFPGKVRGGIFLTLLVGMIGGIAMTWLGRQVGLAMPGHTAGFFTAMIGTGLVLAVWRTAMARPER